MKANRSGCGSGSILACAWSFEKATPVLTQGCSRTANQIGNSDCGGMASQFLTENGAECNIQHHLVPLLRQSVCSRLTGYPDTNDADRLARDPAMRLVVSRDRDGGRRSRKV